MRGRTEEEGMGRLIGLILGHRIAVGMVVVDADRSIREMVQEM